MHRRSLLAGAAALPVASLLGRLQVPEGHIRMFPSHAAAIIAAEQHQACSARAAAPRPPRFPTAW